MALGDPRRQRQRHDRDPLVGERAGEHLGRHLGHTLVPFAPTDAGLVDLVLQLGLVLAQLHDLPVQLVGHLAAQ